MQLKEHNLMCVAVKALNNLGLFHLYDVVSAWNELPSKFDLDGVTTTELRFEDDPEGAVTIVHGVRVKVTACCRPDAAGHRADSSLRSVHFDDRQFVHGHCAVIPF